MTDRWICSRCFTSAPPEASVCPNCGLVRGSDPPTPTATESAAEPSAAVEVEPTGTAAPVPGVGDRWVCLQCFTSNGADAAACTSCGLARGATPTPAAEGVQPAMAVPGRPATTGRRIPWRLVIYGVIALVVVVSTALFAARRGDTGEITAPGSLSVFDLQVGDCFSIETDTSGGSGEIDTVRAIPCADPHVYEMFWSGPYPGNEQPAEETAMSWLEDQCVPAFEAYVGIDFYSSVYYASTLTPTDEGWNSGDHEFSCYLHLADETEVSGSARGAAR